MKWRYLIRMATIVLCAAVTSAKADGPKPFPEFTFKRLAPPKPGSTRRITVQIAPQTEAVTAEKPAAKNQGDAFDWYWAEVSPDMSTAVPGRLAAAVLQLAKGPGVPTPRLETLKSIAETYGIAILKATIGTKVSPALVLAVIGIESSGRPDAISDAGARGLMQLTPDTAKRFGVSDITDPAENIRGGVAYLDWLIGEFEKDPILVLAGYNAGENAVKKYSGVPPFPETRAYVPKALAAWTVARGLCKTPPELITDGCAFAIIGAPTDG
jgi:soluble lytic murein transglycosylase-like protein